MNKYEFPEDAEAILLLRPLESFTITQGGHGIRVKNECGGYDIYEWLPDQPERQTYSFSGAEVDLAINEVASWRKF